MAKKNQLKKIKKIVAAIIIVAISGGFFSAALPAQAAYFDEKTTGENVFSAAALNFELYDAGGNQPSWPFFDLDIGQDQTSIAQTKTIEIRKNPGTIDFEYQISAAVLFGDCQAVNLRAQLGREVFYEGALNAVLFPIVSRRYSDPGDNWTITVEAENPMTENCEFELAFDGIQIGGAGFWDRKTVTSRVNSGLPRTGSVIFEQSTATTTESSAPAGEDASTTDMFFVDELLAVPVLLNSTAPSDQEESFLEESFLEIAPAVEITASENMDETTNEQNQENQPLPLILEPETLPLTDQSLEIIPAETPPSLPESTAAELIAPPDPSEN